MMHHFDMKRYPRERGKLFIQYFGGDYSRGATIQGNTILVTTLRLSDSTGVSHNDELVPLMQHGFTTQHIYPTFNGRTKNRRLEAYFYRCNKCPRCKL